MGAGGAVVTDRPTTRAEGVALTVLADGEWHKGARTIGAGTVLGMVAAALWRRGLAERRGASRCARPSNPGYEYRINDEGRAALETTPREGEG